MQYEGIYSISWTLKQDTFVLNFSIPKLVSLTKEYSIVDKIKGNGLSAKKNVK